jgi:hypothetical protein
MTLIFPTILFICDLCAGLVYLIKGDYRHAIYWFAAATLTGSITF